LKGAEQPLQGEHLLLNLSSPEGLPSEDPLQACLRSNSGLSGEKGPVNSFLKWPGSPQSCSLRSGLHVP
jgi:hypothetical protein